MKDMLTKLFRFPIVMIDGDIEEKRSRKAEDMNLEEEEPDLIIGEAEVPYYDFVSITDRWLPTDSSQQEAVIGNFQACGVTFGQSGQFIVPWTKKKFKRELEKFMASMPEEPAISLNYTPRISIEVEKTSSNESNSQ